MKKCIFTLVTLMLFCGAGAFAKKDNNKNSYAFTRGQECFSNDDYSGAAEWFGREIVDNPKNGMAHFYLAMLHYAQKEYGTALNDVDKALKYLPKKDKETRSLSFYCRSNICLETGDTIGALADLGDAIGLDPSDTDLLYARGDIYYDQKKYDLADADYRKMIELEPGNVMAHMGLGRNAWDRKNYDEAERLFSYVIKLAPDYNSGYTFRGGVYMDLKKWPEAIDDLIKALAIDADEAAFVYLQDVSRGEAKDLVNTKLKLKMAKSPDTALWPYLLGVMATLHNENDAAIAYFEKAESIDANPVFLQFIAKNYAAKYDYHRALEYVENGLAMDSEDYQLMDMKADLLGLTGAFDEALAVRDLLAVALPDNADVYFSRGDLQVDMRHYDNAIEDFTLATALDPNYAAYPYLLLKRGDAYRLSGKTEQAKLDYERLLEAEKDSVLTAESFTPFAYTGLGNREKAIETIQTILANDTTDRTVVLYNAACVYARLGDKEQAMRYLRQAVEAGYPSISHIMVDYDFDLLRDLPEYRDLMKDKTVSPIQDKKVAPDKDPASADAEPVFVPFTKDSGVTKVKCEINGLPLHFVFDTGASDVTMSEVEANFMLKNDYIRPSDIVGSQRYVDANGDISEGTVVILRKVNFGGLELDNVRASVIRNQKAPLLLGQSVLGRLGKIEIDNANRRLKITRK